MSDVTIKKMTEGFYSSKGSKFFGYLRPISALSQLKELLGSVQGLHSESRHICYAYRLGTGNIREAAHDAGEPAHSSGDPILNQLRANKLTNCAGIVARVYGGTKLGIPGLREAYSQAIKDAISKSVMIPYVEMVLFKLAFGYELEGEIQKLISASKAELLGQDFGKGIHYSLRVPEHNAERFEEAMMNLSYKGLRLEKS